MPTLSSPPPDVREDVTTQQLVRWGSWMVMLTGTSIAFVLLFDEPIVWLHVLLNLGAGVMGGVAALLGHRGRWNAAALVLIWGVWGMVCLVAAANGGVRGPNLLSFPVIIVFSGWVLGARYTLWLTACTGVFLVLILWADVHGLLPAAHYGNRLAYLVYLGGVVFITSAATLLSRRSYLRRVEEAQIAARSLAASDAEIRKLLLAVEQSPESVVITDLNGRVEYVNNAFLTRMGYRSEDVLGRLSAEVSQNGMTAAQQAGLQDTLARGETWAGEQTNRRKDGAPVVEAVVVAPIRQPDGRVSHYVELKQDVSERKRAADEIHRLAHFDALTSLPNRTMLMQRLTMLQARARREPGEVHALLLLDLDGFTTLNDARGSEMGDRVLCAVALRLAEVLPANDLLVRVAGDEFAIVLHGSTAQTGQSSSWVALFAERVQAQLLQPLQLDGDVDDAQLGASIGITLYPQGEEDSPQQALRRASTALHRAKEAGGGQLAFFEPGMGEAAEQRFVVERSLRQAIAGNELRLFLQSQWSVDGKLIGAEVLVRWQHPRDGLLAPAAFIPIAEESDLIVSLGTWVLTRACELLARPPLRDLGLRLSVNLSARQFRQAGFVPQLRALLESTGANPHLLTLEVTEGLVIDDLDEAVEKMGELGAMGVEVSLDDFGTGFSSLAYLKRLPIHEIKIDRSFVRDAAVDADDGVLVQAIFSVARQFGLRVVAEGVETKEQADFLRQHAPEVIYQGYLFGRPEPSDAWIERQSHGQVLRPSS